MLFIISTIQARVLSFRTTLTIFAERDRGIFVKIYLPMSELLTAVSLCGVARSNTWSRQTAALIAGNTAMRICYHVQDNGCAREILPGFGMKLQSFCGRTKTIKTTKPFGLQSSIAGWSFFALLFGSPTENNDKHKTSVTSPREIMWLSLRDTKLSLWLSLVLQYHEFLLNLGRFCVKDDCILSRTIFILCLFVLTLLHQQF